MYCLKVRRIGNSLGATLPKEVLAHLEAAAGDQLVLTKTPDGFRLTPYSDEFAAAMDAFEKGRRKYRNALRDLAK